MHCNYSPIDYILIENVFNQCSCFGLPIKHCKSKIWEVEKTSLNQIHHLYDYYMDIIKFIV